MELLSIPVFNWPIDWQAAVNGRWNFDLRELQIGFGQELTDIRQTHVIHGWEFTVDLREGEIDRMDEFLDSLEGRSKSFWMPGPAAAFKISDADSATTFLIHEQGAETSWEAHPGGYLYFTKHGEQPQLAKITDVVDNGDGTETVTITQLAESERSSSSSSDTVGISSSSSSSKSQESSSSSEGDSSSSSLVTSSSSSEFIDIDERWQVFPLYLVRLADDNERVEVCAERWQRRTFKVVELPHEYATASIGQVEPEQPIYLYRFSAALPDGTIQWRFTSHPEDLTIEGTDAQSSSSSDSTDSDSSSSSSSKSSLSESSSSTVAGVTSSSSSNLSSSSSSSSDFTDSTSSSQSLSSSSSSPSSESSSQSSSSSTSAESSSSSSGDGSTAWLAVPIEHDRLSRSTKLGGAVTITADYDSVEPLRLCIPMRLAVPLRVEILRTNRHLAEPESLFNGLIRKPELSGRRVRVQAVEWGEALEQSVPNFFIQRTCNYRVYEAATCKLNREDFEVDVTVAAKAGRQLTVTGAGLAGLAENWFAMGWIELGTGLDREVLYVVSSSAAFGTGVILTTSSPMQGEVPVAGTVVPGCDGLRSTCIAKFDNLDNFGGHAPPKENLTLEAIKTSTSTGKK